MAAGATDWSADKYNSCTLQSGYLIPPGNGTCPFITKVAHVSYLIIVY